MVFTIAVDPVTALMDFCAIDTTTGQEDAALPFLRNLLEGMGAAVTIFEVEPNRHNILATWGEPRILFTTHIDTVAPYIAPHLEGDEIYGRGTCDAKGQAIAQLGAIQQLLKNGAGDLAWLGVVGEETDSCGAKYAEANSEPFAETRLVINGEPTELKLATGQRGAERYRLVCEGVSAHSGTPELGKSAIWMLLDWLQRLRACELPSHELLGQEIFNVGLISGGEGANVVSAHAEATILARTVPGSTFEEMLVRTRGDGCAHYGLSKTPPFLFDSVEGFESATVPFGSDAPRFLKVNPDVKVVLVGPGTIAVAHRPDEHLTISDLNNGIEFLVRLVQAQQQGLTH